MKRTPSTLGDYFVSRRERGDEGLPLVSVTLRDGLVPRNTIERRFESELEDHEHLAVREGDIAYNMMRMWQGASGLAHYDAAVSPAYVVLRPSNEIDPTFASYWFKSARMTYLFWAYSYGLTEDRLRLYYKDFATIPAEPPPIDQQRKIAVALSECDRAIATTEALVAVKRQAKRALSRAFFPPLSQPESVSIRLGDIGTFVRGVTYDPAVDKCADTVGVGICGSTEIQAGRLRTDAIETYVHPSAVQDRQRLRAGDFVICTSNGSKSLVGKAGECRTSDRPLAAGGFCAIFRPKDPTCGAVARQLFDSERYRRFLHVELSGSSIGNLYTSALEGAEFFIPAVKLATVIEMLGTLDREIDILNLQADARRGQKRGLMQKLLPDEWRGNASVRAAAE